MRRKTGGLVKVTGAFQLPTVGDLERLTIEVAEAAQADATRRIHKVKVEMNRRNLLRSSITVGNVAEALKDIHATTIDQVAHLVAGFIQDHGVALEQAIEAVRPHLEAFSKDMGRRLIGVAAESGTSMYPTGEAVDTFRDRLQSMLKNLRVGYIGHRSVVMPNRDTASNALALLEALYQDAQSNFRSPVNFLDVGKKIGLDRATATSANNYLNATGLVQDKTVGGGVIITASGIREIEQAKQNPNMPTANLPAYITINNYSVQNPVNSPVAMASGGAQVTQTATYTATDLTAIRDVVDSIDKNLADLRLDARRDKNARAMMATIRAQLEAEPDLGIVKQAGKSLRNIVDGALGSLAATGVQALPVWTPIAQQLGQFFT